MDVSIDPTERIAGFPLVDIKRAISFVGFDESNDVGQVADSLKVSLGQALKVVDELERRGYVNKLEKPGKLEKTPKGVELAYRWSPPPTYTPIVWREHEEGVCNEVFGDARCSLLRHVDKTDVFEEARLEAGAFVDHEGDRLVEISVSIPETDVDNTSSHMELSVYVSPDEARQFMKLLRQSIAAAEREIQRRKEGPKKSRRKSRPAADPGQGILIKRHGPATPERPSLAMAPWDGRLDWIPSRVVPPATPPRVKEPAKPARTKQERARRAALAGTLREARGTDE
jgi:DNA-binding MarR family transcriptional regulator